MPQRFDVEGLSAGAHDEALLTPAIHALPLVDAGNPSALLCAYTGKEVVECKVLKAVVEVARDQVRWLRLRAGRSKRGSARIARDYSPHTTGALGLHVHPASRSRWGPELPKRPRRVTTSWSIPNSTTGGPQAQACGPFYFLESFLRNSQPRIYADSHG